MKQLFYLLIFLCVGCAQQTALTGGVKDISPPELAVNKTFPRPNTINFLGKEVKLVFNENITYQKSSTSFIANPPIGEHELTVEKNSLKIKFKTSLKENTTYTFMFAKSIADLNEKNNINDLRFCFSTGNTIDSINVNGFVKNSIDKTPNIDFLVSLKSTAKDSLSYLSLTNDNGEYAFSHLKPGKYTLSAWSDLNNNNILDTLEEQHGFLSNAVQIEDSCCKEIINTFDPIVPLEIEAANLNDYGQLTLEFNQKIDTLLIKCLDSSNFDEIIANNNEAILWFSDSTVNSYELLITVPTFEFNDTIVVRKNKSQDEKSKLLYRNNSEKKFFSPEYLHLIFNQELISIDTALIVLKIDSNRMDYKYKIMNNELFITPEIPSGAFNISALPAGFTGFYHRKIDTTKVYFSITPSSNLGTLTINITNSLCNNFIVQLLSNNEVIHELSGTKTILNKTMERVVPGEYDLRLILDNDGNKKWTSGNIKTNSQPEKVIYLDKKIKVQKNWEEFIKWEL
ncbi:MAG: Ig-like domain-containing protein [Flavobacteriales bacterium]|nr:Ig-like domain-containing protein [Flavobacteriales bacterium]